MWDGVELSRNIPLTLGHSEAIAGPPDGMAIATISMANFFRQIAWRVLCVVAALTLPLAASAQTPSPRPRPQTAPVTNVTVDGSEAMFTTMCALLAAGFEADVSADNWQPFRAQIRE